LAIEPFAELGYGLYPNDSPTLINRRDLLVRCGSNFTYWITHRASVSLSAYWLGYYPSTKGADYQLFPDLG
jgi:hypothetical protein